MKKIVFAVLLSLFVFTKPVLAEETTITYNKLQGIAYNQKIGNELKSNIVTFFQMKNRIAYCIEPGVEINERYYDIGYDWNVTNLSSELKEEIEKIGYYGYEYPGHNNSYYYIAAQELIWKAVRPDIEVTWTTEKNLGGSIIDISKEKNEIMDLVNNHSLVPSFADQMFIDYTGKEIILKDENNVLDYYEVSDSNNHAIIRDGNVLKIKLNEKKVDDEEIFLTRKYYDKEPLLVYSRGNSQKLAALRITMDRRSSFTIGNKEEPEEIIEVPDTGIDINLGESIFMTVLGLGMIISVFKIN
ncbi:MAG: thioester domain-containing protein [Bacilli bacterium]|nr:thioester domain-containing protein [Bacilli bacterium]